MVRLDDSVTFINDYIITSQNISFGDLFISENRM